MPFVATNPTTGEVIATYPSLDAAGIETVLDRSHRAFESWRHTSFEERALFLNRAAELLESEVPVVAEMMSREMGKTFAAAKGEVAKCAMTMRYYAEHSEAMLASELIATSGSASGIRFDPIGPVLAIMPWNFPLWQAVRFAAPTLMAGNVGILKHAPNVPACAEFLGMLFLRAGFPEGVFQNAFIEVEDIEAVIADPRVAAVTLTGSERAGRSVAEIAGRNLKKCVLELGGSDAFIVADSANLDDAIPFAVTARVQNNGQSCIASKRFIVVASRAEEFTTRFVEAMAAVVVGNPLDPSTVVGPLVSAAQRDGLAAQVNDGIKKGARALTGGAPLDGPGFFYPPTVLVDVDFASRAGCEELFGPVAVVHTVPDLSAAIALANATPWGLGGSIWATDQAEVDAAISGIEAGMVFANAVVASLPELPFGGIKNSGFGRELSAYGIKEFVNVKTFYQA
ncbi:MAG: NAD-dependent succinate-semialdehyde dehydrogenase [Actinomycetes bacterium]